MSMIVKKGEKEILFGPKFKLNLLTPLRNERSKGIEDTTIIRTRTITSKLNVKDKN
jgi:hypothetical protein